MIIPRTGTAPRCWGRAALVTTIIATVALPTVAAATPAPGIRAQHSRSCAPGDRDSAGCAAIRSVRSDASTGQPLATSATSGYTAAQLRTAYGISGSGSGDASTVVAIVDAYDAPTVAADVARYRNDMGLPALDPACAVTDTSPSFALSPSAGGSPCFVKVGQAGSSATLPAGNTGWAQEIDLDVQMVSAICPLCSILLVEATSNSFGDLTTAVTTASRFAGVRAISNSYSTGVGSDLSAASYPQYTAAAALGIAVTVSTGDSGYGVSFPSTVPQVIAVGGTSLRLAADGTIASQSAWTGTGSGCSRNNGRLTWQSTPAADAACSGLRPTSDVSAVADPATGVSVFYDGAWYVFGGTSVSAPIVGAWLALDGGYSAARSASEHVWSDLAWSDVTSGANGVCSMASLCTGAVGWDGPTGLGALPAVAIGSPVAPTPVFDAPAPTSSGFTASVLDPVPGFSYSATTTAGAVTTGAASGSALALTVTGLSAWQSATVMVVASQAGYLAARGQVTASALPLRPTLSTPVRTADGFTLKVGNWTSAYTFTATTSTGTVTPGTASGTTLPLTVKGLLPGGSATVTVSVTKAGAPGAGSATATGRALLASTTTYTGATSGTHSTAATLGALLSGSGTAIAGAALTFAFNARTYSLTTSSAGTASVRVTLPSKAGSYVVTVRYSGGSTYSASSVSRTIKVT